VMGKKKKKGRKDKGGKGQQQPQVIGKRGK
jgi:hypothetical protein